MIKSKPGTREEDRQTEDEIAREKLGPRGVPGAPDTAKMTEQEEKNIPKSGEFDGSQASAPMKGLLRSASPGPRCSRSFDLRGHRSTIDH